MATTNAEAKDYLNGLLNKSLRVTTTDKRMFLGEFKCTDSDRNIIIAHTYEYRLPSESSIPQASGAGSVTLEMTSRYLGLVVVPGEHITKIELEQFASQMKSKGSRWSGNMLNSQTGTSITTTSEAA
ncbi:hypothetical protein V501_07347 [Pseudogymnoascus sp. VKM F-4519 (FW-2642)]|nr:hypothetical protein V501_07347 [Pseudogymnoascus sp. VKM F-4519 (FW-2642)]OBT56917.1 hypothetical protein VE04_02716 [Pseudogymnoascus sp. 24MN13]